MKEEGMRQEFLELANHWQLMASEIEQLERLRSTMSETLARPRP
jgi:hypothetical protein